MKDIFILVAPTESVSFTAAALVTIEMQEHCTRIRIFVCAHGPQDRTGEYGYFCGIELRPARQITGIIPDQAPGADAINLLQINKAMIFHVIERVHRRSTVISFDLNPYFLF